MANGDAEELNFCRNTGYTSTYRSGIYQAAFNEARSANPAYNSGYSAGQTEGYAAGFAAGTTNGYSAGRNAGYAAGLSVGQREAYESCYQTAYQAPTGYAAGYQGGYTAGYRDVYNGYGAAPAPYDIASGTGGFGDGYYDGYIDGRQTLCGGGMAAPARMYRGGSRNGRNLDPQLELSRYGFGSDAARESGTLLPWAKIEGGYIVDTLVRHLPEALSASEKAELTRALDQSATELRSQLKARNLAN